jgi:glycosyltransferase involved in cell wall biosynthesis
VKKISILIPCYNEEEGIRRVIQAFPKSQLQAYGYEVVVVVIDNNSKDKTGAVARRAGARVIFEGKQGKGNAIRTGMAMVDADTDYVVMLDGDDTYRPEEVMRLVEPLNSGFCDVVIGSRLGGRIPEGAMTGFNLMGNWIFSHLVRYSYRVNVTDVLTGYFAWNKSVVDELWPLLVSDGFAIEMEMITKMARLGHEIYSVPISYNPRAGESSLRPIYDGWRILRMFMRNFAWKPTIEAEEAELDYVGETSPRYRRYVTTFGERIGMRGDKS